MKKWLNAEGIGQLYIEEVLVYGDFPVLFVCLDDHNERYLCMTYDPYESQFVFIRISTEKLIDMIENRIPMEQTFRNADTIFTTEDNEDSEDSDVDLAVKANDSPTFPADHLPAVGEYYDLPSEWLNGYLSKLKEELREELTSQRQEVNSTAVKVDYSEPLKESKEDTIHITYKTAVPVAVLIYGNIPDQGSNGLNEANDIVVVSNKYNYKIEKTNHNQLSNAYSSNAPDDFDNRAA